MLINMSSETCTVTVSTSPRLCLLFMTGSTKTTDSIGYHKEKDKLHIVTVYKQKLWGFRQLFTVSVTCDDESIIGIGAD